MEANLSIRIERVKNPASYVIHDLRLYEKKLPSHINPSRTHINRILYSFTSLPTTEEEAERWVAELTEKCKEEMKRLRKEGAIAKNLRWRKASSPIASGLLSLSYEAQKKLREEGKLEDYLKEATEYLQLLARALGTDLLYAVVHKDETAPHIHFALLNLRYKDPDFEAVKRLEWEDLWETLRVGKGKTVTRTFYGDTSARSKDERPYMVNFSRLQDSLDFFKPSFGFGRGVPKKERMKRGEPKWKVINRRVRQLHEDLPREIAHMEKKLREIEERLREAEERMKEGTRELKKFMQRKKREAGLTKKVVGLVRKEEVYKAEAVDRFLDILAEEFAGAWDLLAQEKEVRRRLEHESRELEKVKQEKERLEKEVESLWREKERLMENIDRLRQVEEDLKIKVRELERQVEKKQGGEGGP